MISTHSRPKAAGDWQHAARTAIVFQHTAARRRLAGSKITLKLGYKVSTHSRPKAAGTAFFYLSSDRLFQHTAARRRLENHRRRPRAARMFQHTAARRRLAFQNLP